MAFHDAKPADHSEERRIRRRPEPPAQIRIHGQRPVRIDVGAAGQRHDLLGREQARGEVLPPDRLGHRHHERGGVSVEPAVPRMRPHGLHDVPRADDGPGRRDEPVGDRGEPVLLATVHVHDVGLREGGPELPDVGEVRARIDAARKAERADPGHALGLGPADHALLGAAAAAEHDRVSPPLELPGDPRGPVGVGGPPAAGHELQDLQRNFAVSQSLTRSGPNRTSHGRRRPNLARNRSAANFRRAMSRCAPSGSRANACVRVPPPRW